MEDCKPCPFATTSKPGATKQEECVPTSQACPVGQMAVGNAVSKQQCSCLPGYGGKQGGLEWKSTSRSDYSTCWCN